VKKKFYILSRVVIILVIICFLREKCFSQSRFEVLDTELEKLSVCIPGLNHELELSVSNVPLKEFIRNIANLTQINIILEGDLNQSVTNNFVNIPAKDVLLFLCKYFDLDLSYTGKILTITKYQPPTKPYKPKTLKIIYDSTANKITFDLKNDSLVLVAKQLTQLTGENFIYSTNLNNKIVSIFLRNLDLENAIDKLAFSNQLKINKKDDIFIIEQDEQTSKASTNKRGASKKEISSDVLDFTIHDIQHIDIYAIEMPISDVITAISKELNISYFILSEHIGTTNINLINVSYEEFLSNVLNGTNYTYSKQNNIYLIGERISEGLRETKLIHLIQRSVVDLSQAIPENLLKDVIIKEFHELNVLIVSGSAPNIYEVEEFIKDIDKPVPLILIEVMIIDNQSGYMISTGISAGVGEAPVKSGGTFLPSVNYTFNSESINKLLNSFNGFGVVNLGKVNPNFYLSIKAMEDAGLVKVRSTPKLSTLNSHEANLIIGNTEYYLEEKSDFIVNQSTQQVTTSTYKSVTADFKLTILPIVSGNDQITLDILVEQSDFTGRISKQAPPGQVSRSFSSQIRVKNDEMVLLGGLEEKSVKDTGTGIPILNRIPIIKWFFSSQTKESKDNKLNIFIKPTIIY